MGDAMKNVALIGAGVKMGVRIAGKLNSSTYDVKLGGNRQGDAGASSIAFRA